MALKHTGKGLNETVAEFHERLIKMSGDDAEHLSVDNQHLRINLRTAKKEADEKRAREEEARKIQEAAEKKREADEKRKKEAKKARKKAEKEKEKKKRDRDEAAISDESETEALKKKKPKVGEYDPKCERCHKTGIPCVPQAQGRHSRACEACSKGKVKCSLSDGDSVAGLSGLTGVLQGLSDSVEEYMVEQRAQWEWERKERESHDGFVEKSFDNLERLLGQQVLTSQASAGALQHMARIMEAFVRRSSPDFMTSMPAGPLEYIPLQPRWKKKKTVDKDEGGSGGKEKEKEGEGEGEGGDKEPEGGDKEGEGGSKEGE
ncbi:hypothetical protein B0H13DRAFT_2335287 [Mycena leptocephala]|nr:hypothetical protein B0H13DRAFT_2335287 [Mycena leptocephala]